ncbi:MAG: YncE family protein [Nitrospinaceae bacterium]|nr:YncE family protein [Nitrospinaceae bacterium]MBT3434886.1 YncE family protein [Nitrospinaceae bacterium]MBT4431914.1 YncE family protein [Nitrospinaceae bacterium]MBT5947493.1 YncE family protein [Nitrospinaceae bacterium]MBT6395892.1 YncE family protein [Nitrospinaceae bacterium]
MKWNLIQARSRFLGLVLLLVLSFLRPFPALADTSFAYVTHIYATHVSVIDVETSQVITTVPVGLYAFEVVISRDGKRVYVASASGTVTVINTASHSVIATVTLGQSNYVNPGPIAVSPDGGRIYVADLTADIITVIDTNTFNTLDVFQTGDAPNDIEVSPDGTRLYVANRFSESVSVFDTSTNGVVANVTVGIWPYSLAVSPDGGRVYVANQNSNNVSVIDTSTNSVVATVHDRKASAPWGITVTPDGSRVYVSNLMTNSMTVIDTASNTQVPAPGLGYFSVIRPGGIAATPDGNFVYVTSVYNKNLTVIDTRTNSVAGIIPLATRAMSVAIGLRTEVLIEDLQAALATLGLTTGLESALLASIGAAADSLERGNTTSAANQIEAFINKAEAQTGKGLTQAQAENLIVLAEGVIEGFLE